MDIEESIRQLGAQLDQWLDQSLDLFAADDLTAQHEALLQGIKIAKEIDAIKANCVASLAELMSRRDQVDLAEWTSLLVRGFELGAKLRKTLHDELGDTDGETEIRDRMLEIVSALDAGPGRVALAALLDHPDASVRAYAGAYLIDLLPERVIPILREIEETQHGNDAHFTADWTLLKWEREGRRQKE